MKAIVSEKGQVTIPKRCRDKLGLRAGTVLEFEDAKGMLIAHKAQTEDVFKKWRGKATLPGSLRVDDYLARIRS